MDWIGIVGGPSLFIAKDVLHLWSGVGDIEAAKNGEYLDVEDTLASGKCHYEVACRVDQLIGLNGWNKEFTIDLLREKYCLIAVTACGFDLEYEEYIEVEVIPGLYQVATLIYKPNNSTSMYLHRLMKIEDPI